MLKTRLYFGISAQSSHIYSSDAITVQFMVKIPAKVVACGKALDCEPFLGSNEARRDKARCKLRCATEASGKQQYCTVHSSMNDASISHHLSLRSC